MNGASVGRQETETAAVVVSGQEPFITFCLIVSIGNSAATTPLLALRAHHSLGDIPALDTTNVPEPARKAVTEALNKVEASMNRLSPTEVVDRYRNHNCVCRSKRAAGWAEAMGHLKPNGRASSPPNCVTRVDETSATRANRCSKSRARRRDAAIHRCDPPRTPHRFGRLAPLPCPVAIVRVGNGGAEACDRTCALRVAPTARIPDIPAVRGSDQKLSLSAYRPRSVADCSSRHLEMPNGLPVFTLPKASS